MYHTCVNGVLACVKGLEHIIYAHVSLAVKLQWLPSSTETKNKRQIATQLIISIITQSAKQEAQRHIFTYINTVQHLGVKSSPIAYVVIISQQIL